MYRQFLVLVPLTLLAVGCGNPEATFVFNERTEGLVPYAKDGMKAEGGEKLKGLKDYIDESFGTPHKLVAWRRLPIEFGGAEGEVVSAQTTDESTILTVKFTSSDLPAPESEDDEVQNLPLQWLSGACSEVESPVCIAKKIDTDANTILVETKLDPAPAVGDTFIVSNGHRLAKGRALYMTHCGHCHGTSGDGNGPTAEYLNPKPRDYRKAVFKFTSTKPANKATKGDLTRIIKRGIPGTYMPSFMLLEDDEVKTIVEYVRWLALRGEMEYKLGAELEGEGFSVEAAKETPSKELRSSVRDFLAEVLPDAADSWGTDLGDSWIAAEEADSQVMPSMPRVPDSKESRRRGRALFLSAKAKCTNCHGPNGLGNGPQTEDYELDPKTKQKMEKPGLYDEWGNIVKPRNLTTGIYRGGRRPIDIFRRLYSGIKGAKMPAFGGTIPDNELWDIVNYVLSVPFEETAPAPSVEEAKPAPAEKSGS